MRKNLFFKLLCSLPIILVTLYFIPFLGVCLLLLRLYVYQKKYFSTPVILVLCGFLLWLPKIVSSILEMAKITEEIPYLNDILSSDIYPSLLSYSKLLITVGIIFSILSFMFRQVTSSLSSKLNSTLRSYMEKDLQQDYEVRKENDLKMQEKRKRRKCHYENRIFQYEAV